MTSTDDEDDLEQKIDIHGEEHPTIQAVMKEMYRINKEEVNLSNLLEKAPFKDAAWYLFPSEAFCFTPYKIAYAIEFPIEDIKRRLSAINPPDEDLDEYFTCIDLFEQYLQEVLKIDEEIFELNIYHNFIGVNTVLFSLRTNYEDDTTVAENQEALKKINDECHKLFQSRFMWYVVEEQPPYAGRNNKLQVDMVKFSHCSDYEERNQQHQIYI